MFVLISVFIKSIVTFLAIYGLVQLLKDLWLWFLKENKCEDLVIVIKVKNSEESLEATIRMIIWKYLKYESECKLPEIIIVDMGSEDSTPEIARKLCQEYCFIHYTTEDIYIIAKE